MTETRMPVLPKRAYTSKAFFQLEQRAIFSATWQFAGLLEDVHNPGDFVTVQAGLYNILVVRGRDQRLRAFHNLCRHRGTQLLRAVGKTQKAITCPYHDWTYSLQGDLISVPDERAQFPNLDKSKLCLHKAAVETWRGMIFVHPDPNAAPLMRWLGDIERYLGPHQPELLKEYEGSAQTHTIKANWKIVAENYIDGYHLAHLHAATLNMYDHSRQQSGFMGPHYVFYEPLTPDYQANLATMAPFPRIKEVADAQLGAYVPLIFPNLGLSEMESAWSIFHIIPLAPDKTRVVMRTKVAPMSDWEALGKSITASMAWSGAGGGGKYGGAQDADDPMSWGDFMAEDIFACEQQQKSLKSPLFSVGATALELEASVRTFQSTVQGMTDAAKRDEHDAEEG